MKNQPTSTTRLLQCIHTSTGGVSIVVDDIEIGDVTVDVCNKGSNEAWVTDVTTCDCSCTLSTGVRGVAVVVISIVDATLVEVVAATATAVSKRDPRPRPRRPFRCNTGGHPRTVTAISSLIAAPAPTNRVPRRWILLNPSFQRRRRPSPAISGNSGGLQHQTQGTLHRRHPENLSSPMRCL
jgi:hypothetical protein